MTEVLVFLPGCAQLVGATVPQESPRLSGLGLSERDKNIQCALKGMKNTGLKNPEACAVCIHREPGLLPRSSLRPGSRGCPSVPTPLPSPSLWSAAGLAPPETDQTRPPSAPISHMAMSGVPRKESPQVWLAGCVNVSQEVDSTLDIAPETSRGARE